MWVCAPRSAEQCQKAYGSSGGAWRCNQKHRGKVDVHATITNLNRLGYICRPSSMKGKGQTSIMRLSSARLGNLSISTQMNRGARQGAKQEPTL